MPTVYYQDMIKNIEVMGKRYQHLICGDLVELTGGRGVGIVMETRGGGEEGSNRYKIVVDPYINNPFNALAPQNFKHYLYNNNYYNSFSDVERIITRPYLNTSDYYCREICDIQTDCNECPLQVPLENLRKFYFNGDIVVVRGYKCRVVGSGIDINYETRIEIKNKNLTLMDGSYDLIINSNPKIYYDLKYLDSNLLIDNKDSSELRLYHRRGFTLDPGTIDKYCLMCYGGDKCKTCLIDVVKENEDEKRRIRENLRGSSK